MKRISAGVVLAGVVATVGLTTSAQADDPPPPPPPTGSVQIVTTVATAYGPWAQNPPDPPYVSKPTYPTHMLIVCPAGRDAQVDMSPVWSMTIPGIAFACTGSRQEVVFNPTAAPSSGEGWHAGSVSATLNLRAEVDGGPLTQLDADVAQVCVQTLGTGDKPPGPPTDAGARPPCAPRAVHATSASHRATLIWTRPASTGGACIDLYQVRRGASPVRDVPGSRSRFTFTRLTNGHTYSLFVRAHNRVGFSGWVRAVARPH